MELKLKKCLKCGSLVEVLNDCNCQDCGLMCCNEEMKELKNNSVDASFEKHVPNYERNNDMIKVNVLHVMDDDHYIEWIMVVYENEQRKITFKPRENPSVAVPYQKGAKLYAYCNKHGIWMCEVE